ncbi:hypothetical protein K458DRAFT_409608 [Lentithecium fluviatile CBS 122367]|uniref:Uncharacterized protein n=1 Tax=Lentithecium fluviatile CBS 122367 TaxID=1168545 RepID=A0A6G1II71_9PLEO|nr:hypothetical protein K458DRAFT_409608 [Lentithecium fluviatile CBS 122367]
MSDITVDHLTNLMANPPKGDALIDLVKSMRDRRTYLHQIRALHITFLSREEIRFKIASDPVSPFSMERPASLRAIACYKVTIALHTDMLATLHEHWVTFHEKMHEGTRLLFGEGKVVEGGVVHNVEEGIRRAEEAKLCLDKIEWALFAWRKSVIQAMVEISDQLAREWRDGVAVRFPRMMGKEEPTYGRAPASPTEPTGGCQGGVNGQRGETGRRGGSGHRRDSGHRGGSRGQRGGSGRRRR